MGFSSITFLFYFLPVFLILYYVVPVRNLVLLTGSLVFYAWGEPVFIALLVISILANYSFGLWLSASRGRKGGSVRMACAIAVNLAILAWFKYAGFVAAQLGFVSLSSNPPHLPLGISFFTFHAISYLIDIYRGDAKVERNPLQLGLYISMFPQLVAGPIVRYKNIFRELKDRTVDLDRFALGVRFFAIGLGQKVLVADVLASCADQVFALPASELTAATAWVGLLSYSLQIYFDFSGYSHMAIGLAHMLGFTFPENFNFPYISRSITEFWRRWHITLSSWFRDYVYIPLGGDRRGRIRTYINLWTVFLLCGLWHGASWNFIAWGAYHGALLAWERKIGRAFLQSVWPPLAHAYAVLAVALGWVLFRCVSLDHAGYFFKALFGLGVSFAEMNPPGRFLSYGIILALALGALCSTPALALAERWLTAQRPYLGASVGSAFAIVLFTLAALGVANATYSPFIYFRF
jgi:alginate O-acetyltransferase complex protein AlgI